jgi:hypothetical protein
MHTYIYTHVYGYILVRQVEEFRVSGSRFAVRLLTRHVYACTNVCMCTRATSDMTCSATGAAADIDNLSYITFIHYIHLARATRALVRHITVHLTSVSKTLDKSFTSLIHANV